MQHTFSLPAAVYAWRCVCINVCMHACIWYAAQALVVPCSFGTHHIGAVCVLACVCFLCTPVSQMFTHTAMHCVLCCMLRGRVCVSLRVCEAIVLCVPIVLAPAQLMSNVLPPWRLTRGPCTWLHTPWALFPVVVMVVKQIRAGQLWYVHLDGQR